MNKFKLKLRHGGVAIGASIGLADPNLVEILGYIGFDFILMDIEHGAIGIETLERMIVAGYLGDMIPFIKLASLNREMITLLLDIGALGIMVPHIHNAAEVRKVMEASKYGPEGKRGVGPGRPIRFGQISLKKYMKKSKQEIMVSIMIEEKEAAENIEEIVKIPGIDFFFIGTYDLSASLGVPGEIGHRKVRQAVDNVLEAAGVKGIPVGIGVANRDEAIYWLKKGIRVLVTMAVEDVVVNKYTELLDELQTSIEEN